MELADAVSSPMFSSNLNDADFPPEGRKNISIGEAKFCDISLRRPQTQHQQSRPRGHFSGIFSPLSRLQEDRTLALDLFGLTSLSPSLLTGGGQFSVLDPYFKHSECFSSKIIDWLFQCSSDSQLTSLRYLHL